MSMMRVVIVALLFAGFSVPATARRGGDDDVCTNAPRSEWQPVSSVEEKAGALGYSVLKSEISGTCYEVYGGKDGIVHELYFNPVTAELVKVERD
jgi:hypothetical protein